MSNKPWEQWYWKDWLSDMELQRASASTRGIWANLLGYMWQSDTAELTLTAAELCRLGGCLEGQARQFIEEASALGFCYTSRDPNGDITIGSRRRKRQEKTRKNNAERQRRYYQKHKPNGKSDGVDPDPDPDPELKKKRGRSRVRATATPNKGNGAKQVKPGKNIPPSLADCQAYWLEQNFVSDPDAFFDHHESNGWRTSSGKGALMKDWHAGARNWERRDREWHPEKHPRHRSQRRLTANDYNADGTIKNSH